MCECCVALQHRVSSRYDVRLTTSTLTSIHMVSLA
jgi:hypothetical protein